MNASWYLAPYSFMHTQTSQLTACTYFCIISYVNLLHMSYILNECKIILWYVWIHIPLTMLYLYTWLCLCLQNHTLWLPDSCTICTCLDPVSVCENVRCLNPNCFYAKVCNIGIYGHIYACSFGIYTLLQFLLL